MAAYQTETPEVMSGTFAPMPNANYSTTDKSTIQFVRFKDIRRDQVTMVNVHVESLKAAPGRPHGSIKVKHESLRKLANLCPKLFPLRNAPPPKSKQPPPSKATKPCSNPSNLDAHDGNASSSSEDAVDREWDVECITDQRMVGSKMQYLTHWKTERASKYVYKRWPPTWQPASDLINCIALTRWKAHRKQLSEADATDAQDVLPRQGAAEPDPPAAARQLYADIRQVDSWAADASWGQHPALWKAVARHLFVHT